MLLYFKEYPQKKKIKKNNWEKNGGILRVEDEDWRSMTQVSSNEKERVKGKLAAGRNGNYTICNI